MPLVAYPTGEPNWLGVGVEVAVFVAVAVAVFVGVAVLVTVGVFVGVEVAEGGLVAVLVGVSVGATVGVEVRVCVAVKRIGTSGAARFETSIVPRRRESESKFCPPAIRPKG